MKKILIGVHNRLTTNKHAVLVFEYTSCGVETFLKGTNSYCPRPCPSNIKYGPRFF